MGIETEYGISVPGDSPRLVQVGFGGGVAPHLG
jgi:hypothetical protein